MPTIVEVTVKGVGNIPRLDDEAPNQDFVNIDQIVGVYRAHGTRHGSPQYLHESRQVYLCVSAPRQPWWVFQSATDRHQQFPMRSQRFTPKQSDETANLNSNKEDDKNGDDTDSNGYQSPFKKKPVRPTGRWIFQPGVGIIKVEPEKTKEDDEEIDFTPETRATAPSMTPVTSRSMVSAAAAG